MTHTHTHNGAWIGVRTGWGRMMIMPGPVYNIWYLVPHLSGLVLSPIHHFSAPARHQPTTGSRHHCNIVLAQKTGREHQEGMTYSLSKILLPIISLNKLLCRAAASSRHKFIFFLSVTAVTDANTKDNTAARNFFFFFFFLLSGPFHTGIKSPLILSDGLVHFMPLKCTSWVLIHTRWCWRVWIYASWWPS